MIKNLCLAFIALFVFSCSNDPDTEPARFLFYNTRYVTTPIDLHWIIIHDNEGNVLHCHSIDRDDHISYSPPAEMESLGFTVLTVHHNRASVNYGLETYLDINLPFDGTSQRAELLHGYRGGLTVSISDENLSGTIPILLSSRGVGSFSDGPEHTSVTCPTYESEDDLLLVAFDNSEKPLYKWIENALPGEKSYSLSDLEQFDGTVELTFPETRAYDIEVTASEEGEHPYQVGGYRVSRYFYSESRSKVTLGFLNQFPKYLITGDVECNGYGYLYRSFGSMPSSSVNLENDLDFTITNNTRENFTVSGNGIERTLERWFSRKTVDEKEIYTSWSVHRAQEGQSKLLLNLPEFLLQAYPDINLSELKLRELTVFKGRSYQSFMNEFYLRKYSDYIEYGLLKRY